MPIPKLVQITAWSYSRFNDYEKCPALAKYKHVDKLKEPDNPAMAGGTVAHEQAAGFTIGKLKKLPAVLARFHKEFAALKKAKAVVEKEWAFNRQWEPVGWFAPDAWLRIKVDAHSLKSTVVSIVDHKTGKEREDHVLQRDLYALGALLMYPYATVVKAAHWYLDAGVMRESTYKAADLERLKREWVDRTTRMLSDKRFAPQPGNHCRWCFFSSAKGGPCRF